jgi:hypothetical protein
MGLSSRAFLVFAGLLWALGCSPYHEVRDVSGLGGRDQRVVVVEVIPEGKSVSDQFDGIYLGSNLVVDEEIPMDEGRPNFSPDSGHEVSSDFSAQGGVVTIGAPAGQLYILGIRASTTHLLWNTMTFFPMVVRIPPAVAPCEYVGTVHLRGPSNFDLRDEFDQSGTRLAANVAGCNLTRNIGARVGFR